jgi:hypothetical protein
VFVGLPGTRGVFVSGTRVAVATAGALWSFDEQALLEGAVPANPQPDTRGVRLFEVDPIATWRPGPADQAYAVSDGKIVLLNLADGTRRELKPASPPGDLVGALVAPDGQMLGVFLVPGSGLYDELAMIWIDAATGAVAPAPALAATVGFSLAYDLASGAVLALDEGEQAIWRLDGPGKPPVLLHQDDKDGAPLRPTLVTAPAGRLFAFRRLLPAVNLDVVVIGDASKPLEPVGTVIVQPPGAELILRWRPGPRQLAAVGADSATLYAPLGAVEKVVPLGAGPAVDAAFGAAGHHLLVAVPRGLSIIEVEDAD